MPREKKNIPAIPFEFKEAVSRLLKVKPPERTPRTKKMPKRAKR